MAFLTTDRMGRMKANPAGIKENFLYGDTEVIFAHSLAAVLTDGTIASLNNGGSLRAIAGIKAIVYADERLAPEVDNPRTHTGGLDADSGEALSGVIVLLDVTGTFAAGSEDSPVYAVDDHTVSLDDGSGTRPYVGNVVKRVNDTLAYVYVPGLLKSSVAA